MMPAKEGKSRKRDRSKLRKRKLLDNENFLEMPNSTADQFCPESETDLKKMKKDKQERKRKKNKTSIEKDESHGLEGEKTGNKMSTKRKRKTYRGSEHAVGKYDQCMSNCEDDSVKLNDESKKVGKKSKRACPSSKNGNSLVEKRDVASSDEVYNISSADKDCTKGMKKWIMEYHQSRPGLKILQQKIDEFITAHEAKEEQARKEREAQAAEGGWTVVVHHKGRKKTTDSESGMTVGSVAQAAVLDKMGKKKSKEVGLDFYRFQKREAQRNEIMMLQSKFEQDKRRIQQLRAARKFRPY